jgi:hypothetical protein
VLIVAAVAAATAVVGRAIDSSADRLDIDEEAPDPL